MKKFDYDIIIIGSGSAGSAAAFAAADSGASVAIVENSKWGGDSLNGTDLPLRSALTFTHAYQSSLRAVRFGVSSSSLRFNYPSVKNWLATSRRRSGANSRRALESAGVSCLSGLAHFLSPYELSVGEKVYSSGKFIIASGTHLSLGGISGSDSVDYLTPSSALSLSRPPKSLIIVGGGSTGCELAEFFSSVGTKVTLLELAPRLVPREDEEVGSVLSSYLEDVLGIKVLTQSRVLSISRDKDGVKASILRGGLEKSVTADSILLATGECPSLDLGLENSGVAYSDAGIKSDSFLQTSMKHIYAVGSCAGGVSSTELAAYEGALAASNALGRQKNLVNRTGFIRTVRVYPEVSAVGPTEDELIKKGTKYKKSLVSLASVMASNVEDYRLGFLKLLASPQGKVIGATLMCPNSSLIASELALAVRHSLPVLELASSPVISSSWAELLRLASRSLLRK